MEFSIDTSTTQRIHRVLDWNDIITVHKRYTTVRAKEGRKLLGQACIAFKGDEAWIYWFVVNPKYRNQGIGTLLLDKVESIIENKNIHKICLTPQKENEKFLIPWYQGMGYEKTKKNPETGEWIMIKEI